MLKPKEINQLLERVYEAGEIALAIYKDAFEIIIKEDHSPLTQADLAVNAYLCDSLASLNPRIISEENAQIDYQERKNWDSFWLIDPIDGTQEFVNKTDQWCICVAFIQDNEAVLGIIYAPALRRMYWAAEGLGAYRMLVPDAIPAAYFKQAINHSALLPLKHLYPEQYIFLHSVNYLDPQTQDYIKALQQTQANLIPKAYGAALKFCTIAEGEANEYTRLSSLNEWDAAAGYAILKYSGIAMHGLDGKEIAFNTEDLKIPAFQIKYQYADTTNG